MTFPQPDSNSAVLAGFDFFRLNTPLVSPGDIYESLQGCRSIVMGPTSDLSQIQVNYYNATRNISGQYTGPTQPQPSFIDSVIVTPQRGFNGSVAARNDAKYQPANRPGRILFSPVNLWDQTYVPQFPFAGVTVVQNVPPLLDIIQYFDSLPSVPPQRDDKELYYQNFLFGVSFGNPDNISLIVPYYGRKYAFVEAANHSTVGHNIAVSVRGLNYQVAPAPTAGDETLLGQNLVMVPGTIFQQVVKASTNGMFDALIITVGLDNPVAQTQFNTPVRIRMSDDQL